MNALEVIEVPPPAKKRRRRTTVLITLLVVAVVLGLLGTIGWLAGEQIARTRIVEGIRSEIMKAQVIPEDADVTVEIGAEPVLPQLIAGRLNQVEIGISKFTTPLASGSAELVLNGVPTASGGSVESISIAVKIPLSVLKDSASRFTNLPIQGVKQIDQNTAQFDVAFTVFGLTVPMTVDLKLSATPTAIGFQPVSATINGAKLDLAAVKSTPILGDMVAPLLAPQSFCVADLLPGAFRLDDVKILGSSLLLTASGYGVVLDASALTPTGRC